MEELLKEYGRLTFEMKILTAKLAEVERALVGFYNNQKTETQAQVKAEDGR